MIISGAAWCQTTHGGASDKPLPAAFSRLCVLSRLLIPRMLTTGSFVAAATAVRLSATCLGLLAERTPPLLALAVRGSLGGDGTAASQAAFRDELIALARDCTERSWHELRRGVDELDTSTRPPVPAGSRRARPYRVKP